MKKTILIADDDPAILESIRLILEEFGYTVDSTSDGQTIDKMEKGFPDLLLLDIWMSGQDGREICKHLKKDVIKKAIPVIMISASRDSKQSTIDAGADDFLAKPFEMDALLEKVAKWA